MFHPLGGYPRYLRGLWPTGCFQTFLFCHFWVFPGYLYVICFPSHHPWYDPWMYRIPQLFDCRGLCAPQVDPSGHSLESHLPDWSNATCLAPTVGRYVTIWTRCSAQLLKLAAGDLVLETAGISRACLGLLYLNASCVKSIVTSSTRGLRGSMTIKNI